MKKQLSQYNSSTQKFIRSRRISAILPWLGILGMLLLFFINSVWLSCLSN